MLDSYLEKLEYMKSIQEQAEQNGLGSADFMPDHVRIILKNKIIKIWYKNGKIE